MKRHGAITQVELAGATGLSPASVSNIVRELADAGVLHLGYGIRSGRRATRVTLARQQGLVLGVHYSQRYLRMALADAGRIVVAEHHLPLPPEHRADASLDRAALMLGDMLESVEADRSELRAIGIALPAPVDTAAGRISVPGLLRGWDGVDVARTFEARVGIETHVDNEANLAALAEWQDGSGKGVESLFYLSASYGIAGGLILGGRPFRGRRGIAGEIGHVSIDEAGPICRCGNRGCLEAFAGSGALLEQLPSSHRALKLADLVHRANDGDAVCRRVVADAGRRIGFALAKAQNLLDVDRVVIGGELAETNELLLSPIRHAFEAHVLGGMAAAPEVVAAALGSRAQLVGAVALALQNIEGRVAVVQSNAS